MSNKISLFWFRRDLRLEDNRALHEALQSGYAVLALFIFDEKIIDGLKKDDPRISFIYGALQNINKKLQERSSSIYCMKGNVETCIKSILSQYAVQTVYANEDYEPYAIERDEAIRNILRKKGIEFNLYKDQVIFAKDEIVKNNGLPYTVFTPYKNKWLATYHETQMESFNCDVGVFIKNAKALATLKDLGFQQSSNPVRHYTLNDLSEYEKYRDFPALDKTTYLSVHLRFGTVSIRKIINRVDHNISFLSELIWREFFMQILYHFPHIEHANFKAKYDHIKWRNNLDEFDAWKQGKTGFPMVDAGLRQLNATGYMHNRVRMIAAGFLCKHLLIDWRWGEAYFAQKLLDYELSSNNGNWQWASGTGCDAAPYFRVFNPHTQLDKFDAKRDYVKQWIPELETADYPSHIVDHKIARLRAIDVYRRALRQQ